MFRLSFFTELVMKYRFACISTVIVIVTICDPFFLTQNLISFFTELVNYRDLVVWGRNIDLHMQENFLGSNSP